MIREEPSELLRQASAAAARGLVKVQEHLAGKPIRKVLEVSNAKGATDDRHAPVGEWQLQRIALAKLAVIDRPIDGLQQHGQ